MYYIGFPIYFFVFSFFRFFDFSIIVNVIVNVIVIVIVIVDSVPHGSSELRNHFWFMGSPLVCTRCSAF